MQLTNLVAILFKRLVTSHMDCLSEVETTNRPRLKFAEIYPQSQNI